MVAQAECTDFIFVACKYCHSQHVIFYDRQDMVDWMSGSGAIQDILHYLSVDDRELVLSNTCGSCFDSMFPPLDIHN